MKTEELERLAENEGWTRDDFIGRIIYLEEQEKELIEKIETAYKAGHRNHISSEDDIEEYWQSYRASQNLKTKKK